MKRKPFHVGDEIVVINGRRWVPMPARTSIIEEVHARGVYIRGHSGFLSKTAIAHRTPDAELLGQRLDLLDALDDEREQKRSEAVVPIEAEYAQIMDPIRQQVRDLWRKVNDPAG